LNLGSDDFQLRVYNYNTSEKVTSFEAHPDYIRAIAVHPTQPFVLTASVGSPVDRKREAG
jgi:coatomer subunit beta'